MHLLMPRAFGSKDSITSVKCQVQTLLCKKRSKEGKPIRNISRMVRKTEILFLSKNIWIYNCLKLKIERKTYFS